MPEDNATPTNKADAHRASAKKVKQAFAAAVRDLRAQVKAGIMSEHIAKAQRQAWLDGEALPGSA